MSGFVKIAKSSEVKKHYGSAKQIGETHIALFRDSGKIYALCNRCPHQGAPIHMGFIRDGCVVCPQHGWSFRLEDGAFTHNEHVKIKTYPVKEEHGLIFVKLDNQTEN
jgi:NAD(P)H-dependent nitrite reductase small subunit